MQQFCRRCLWILISKDVSRWFHFKIRVLQKGVGLAGDTDTASKCFTSSTYKWPITLDYLPVISAESAVFWKMTDLVEMEKTLKETNLPSWFQREVNKTILQTHVKGCVYMSKQCSTNRVDLEWNRWKLSEIVGARTKSSCYIKLRHYNIS